MLNLKKKKIIAQILCAKLSGMNLNPAILQYSTVDTNETTLWCLYAQHES